LDGRVLVYTSLRDAPLGPDIWIRTDLGPSARMHALIERAGAQTEAQLSPDRRLLAYVSNEAGPNDVFVAEFQLDAVSGAATAVKSIRLSEGGGFAPRWRADGRELFYLKADGAVMSVEISATHQALTTAAKRIFAVPNVIPEWGVAPDGERFLFAVPIEPPPPFNVVQGWRSTVHQ
jgi:Tol biopolymer transport system component